jgi:hypothetical protein
MEHEFADEHGLGEAAASIDRLTGALLDQLDVLRDLLRDTSSHDLAAALAELQERVGELLDLGLHDLGAVGEASLREIGRATRRIERARRRIVDDLAPTTTAEGALRRWTASVPGDRRIRPTVADED